MEPERNALMSKVAANAAKYKFGRVNCEQRTARDYLTAPGKPGA